jgi:hypothetical protein
MSKENLSARRINDAEMSLIKNTFAENDMLLVTIRKALLGISLNADEKKLIAQVMKGDVVALIRKIFLPEITGTEPLGQTVDLWMTLSITDKTSSQVEVLVNSRKILIDWLETAINAIVAGKKVRDVRSFSPSTFEGMTELNANIIARNTYIGHVEQQLLQLKMLAGMKAETVDQTKQRLGKDSAK